VQNSIGLLRRAGFMEAISFIVLIAGAMPLKYIWGRPEAVRVAGLIHGLLFIAFCAALLRVMILCRWPLGRGTFVFAMALLPFGPFLIDRKLRDWEAQAVSVREDRS
jgi:integral membrane protein